MTLIDADIIDHAPVYSSEDHIAEIAQALMFHYAILVSQGSQFGIITRADYLKMVFSADYCENLFSSLCVYPPHSHNFLLLS